MKNRKGYCLRRDEKLMTVFKEMTLGKQIASGIALMLLLMLVVGGLDITA